MAEYNDSLKEKLIQEASEYPDKKVDLEDRTFLLEELFQEAGVDRIHHPKAIVLGAGRGADLFALKNLNNDTEFIAAVDQYPPSNPHDITDNEGNILARTEPSEIVEFLRNPQNSEKIREANLIIGTRLGPETISYIIQYLPQDSNYMGIFTTDAGDMRKVIENSITSRNGVLLADSYSSANEMETVFRVTPNRPSNEMIDIMQKTASDSSTKVA